MKKKILTIGIVLALVAAMVMPMAAFADNTGPQSASTSQATTITVVAKSADTAITLITFPVGAPSTVINTPYNNVDGTDPGDISTGPQVLHASTSEPVVRLKNTSAETLTIWLGITDWTNSAVASERFKLMDPATTTVESLTGETALGASATTSTTIAAAAYKALYLEVTLGALAGKTGTSTLTVLGES